MELFGVRGDDEADDEAEEVEEVEDGGLKAMKLK